MLLSFYSHTGLPHEGLSDVRKGSVAAEDKVGVMVDFFTAAEGTTLLIRFAFFGSSSVLNYTHA